MRKVTTPKLLLGIEGYDIGFFLLGILLGLPDISRLNDRLRLFGWFYSALLSLGVF